MGGSQRFIGKYRCDYCNVHVRDTQLERTNHESTGLHKGRVKRFIHEAGVIAGIKGREREMVRREHDRLNGIADSDQQQQQQQQQQQGKGYYATQAATQAAEDPAISEAERREQLEQLVELGVAIPSDYRGDLAMPGEWVAVEPPPSSVEKMGGGAPQHPGSAARGEGEKSTSGRAVGVRQKRGPPTEEEREEEEAVRNLAKRKRPRWGKDTKTLPGDQGDDDGLDALLSGVVASNSKNAPSVKKEEEKEEDNDDHDHDEEKDGVKAENGGSRSDEPAVKKEEPDGGESSLLVKAEPAHLDGGQDAGDGDKPTTDPVEEAEPIAPAVVFRKRKAKNPQPR